MRDLTPLENELDNLKRHNSYLAFRISHAVSSGEIAMLESAMKVNNEGIASIESEMGKRFVCLDCYSDFNQNEGTITENQGHQEFLCNVCSNKSACEICGTWTENHATIFWNCLCKECWETEKERE